jgi:hypothetical protein
LSNLAGKKGQLGTLMVVGKCCFRNQITNTHTTEGTSGLSSLNRQEKFEQKLLPSKSKNVIKVHNRFGLLGMFKTLFRLREQKNLKLASINVYFSFLFQKIQLKYYTLITLGIGGKGDMKGFFSFITFIIIFAQILFLK